MKREPFIWDDTCLNYRSPEGASTIEEVPGATIETAHEVARLLERTATFEITSIPPGVDEVLKEMDGPTPNLA